jgi:hypothetical protein
MIVDQFVYHDGERISRFRLSSRETLEFPVYFKKQGIAIKLGQRQSTKRGHSSITNPKYQAIYANLWSSLEQELSGPSARPAGDGTQASQRHPDSI